MPLLLEVKCASISSILDQFRRGYNDALCLTVTDEQNVPCALSEGESTPQTDKPFESLIKRSAAKYFGYMILKSLVELSKSSTKEIQDAFSQVYVFCRSKEAPDTNPYSFIQSIFVPGLFYIELGHFLKVDFHIEGAKYQANALDHLDGLKLLGFVPLLHTDLKNAEGIRFCPGGVSNLRRDYGEFRYQVNSQKPSLLTQDVLKQLIAIFTQVERKFLLGLNGDNNHAGIKNPITDRILEKSNLFKCALKGWTTTTSQFSSDSDDDFQNLPVHELNFFTHLNRPDSSKGERRSLDDMGPYEKYKLGIE